jgi:hypothetical protein
VSGHNAGRRTAICAKMWLNTFDLCLFCRFCCFVAVPSSSDCELCAAFEAGKEKLPRAAKWSKTHYHCTEAGCLQRYNCKKGREKHSNTHNPVQPVAAPKALGAYMVPQTTPQTRQETMQQALHLHSAILQPIAVCRKEACTAAPTPAAWLG